MTVPDRRLPFVLFLAILCVGCVTERNESDRGSFAGGMRRQPADKPAERAEAARARPEPDVRDPAPEPRRPERANPAPPPRPVNAPNTRVMFYQPKGDLLLIIVNESHSGRATEAGRLDLSLGDPNRAYKILSDSQMEALIKSLAAQGYDQNAAEFVPEDAQYLTASSTELPRYQGLISVERGPMKTKVLGFRKSSEGDALGARRYQTYALLKGLVQKWFSDSSRSEFPVGGVSLPAK
jgi:hypothetical protein